MAKLEFGKIIGGVGAGALVHFLEQRFGESSQLTNPANIVPILLAGASVLGFAPKIVGGKIGKIVGDVGQASIGLVSYKIFKSGLPTVSGNDDTRIFRRSVSPVNTFTGDMSLSGL
jgi:hypothetical protein